MAPPLIDILASRKFSFERRKLGTWFISFFCHLLIVVIIIYLVTMLNDASGSKNFRFIASIVPSSIIAVIIYAILVIALWLFRRLFPKFSLSIWPYNLEVKRNEVLASEVIEKLIETNEAVTRKIERIVVLKDIDERVRSLSKRNAVILLSIAVALISATLVVMFAGRLTGLDASAVSNVDRLAREIADNSIRLDTLSQEANYYGELERLQGANAKPEIIDQYIRRRSSVGYLTFSKVAADAEIEKTKTDLAMLRDLQKTAWLAEINSKNAESELRYILATAITRIGVVAMIVYLVQIFMGFYRYNTRLISHYKAKRDFVTLWDGNERSAKVVASMFAAPKVDFRGDPRHPFGEISKLVGAKVEEAVSRMSGKGKKPPGGEAPAQEQAS